MELLQREQAVVVVMTALKVQVLQAEQVAVVLVHSKQVQLQERLIQAAVAAVYNEVLEADLAAVQVVQAL
jgi:hypothetical protein